MLKHNSEFKRILIYNQYYPPVNNPPAKRLSGLSEYLSKKGYKVFVVTGMPNYPIGRFYKGYSRFFKIEQVNGVKVIRVFEIPLQNKGVIYRLVNYVSFAVISLFTLPVILKVEIVIISTPPLLSAISYYFLCKLLRKKIILDVRDLWPESVLEVTNIKKGILYEFFLNMSNYLYRNSNAVVCVNKSHGKIIENRGAKKIHIVPNFSKNKKYVDTKDAKVFVSRFKIVFTGIITKIQGLENFLNLNSFNNIRDKFEWHLVGYGEELEHLKEICRINKYDNVYFYGYRDQKFCEEKIKSADLCLVPLTDVALTKMTLPFKFIDYSSFGKPVIANCSEEVKLYIKKYKCGFFLNDFKDTKEINSICDLSTENLSAMSINSKKMFDSEFSINTVLERYIKIIENV